MCSFPNQPLKPYPLVCPARSLGAPGSRVRIRREALNPNLHPTDLNRNPLRKPNAGYAVVSLFKPERSVVIRQRKMNS